MAVNIRLHSFATRLLLTLLSLVALTALSTSVPAYWLTRRQLEEQAWKNVSNAQQATVSLLQAETTRLTNLVLGVFSLLLVLGSDWLRRRDM